MTTAAVEHPTRKERVARGKAAREESPRERHAEWSTAQRRNQKPLDMLAPERGRLAFPGTRACRNPLRSDGGDTLHLLPRRRAANGRGPGHRATHRASMSSSAATPTCPTSGALPRPERDLHLRCQRLRRDRHRDPSNGISSAWRASLEIAAARDRDVHRPRTGRTSADEFDERLSRGPCTEFATMSNSGGLVLPPRHGRSSRNGGAVRGQERRRPRHSSKTSSEGRNRRTSCKRSGEAHRGGRRRAPLPQ